MSRSFDPDDPAFPAHNSARNSSPDNSPPNNSAPNNFTTPVYDAHPPPPNAETEDYIEAEYVGSEYAVTRSDARTHAAGHDETASTHDEHPHATHSMRDTLTRIPDALGAIGRDISRTLERAISAKDEYVVAVKVTADAQAKLEQLVQAGVFRTRAEAAAFLIDEGIEAQAALFLRVDQKLAEIERLRAELRGMVNSNPNEGA